jgi:hypothetical protein
VAELDAQLFRHPGQALGELEAVAVLVARQLQAANEFAADIRERRPLLVS